MKTGEEILAEALARKNEPLKVGEPIPAPILNSDTAETEKRIVELTSPEVIEPTEPTLGVRVHSVNGFVLVLFSRNITELKLTKKDARQLAALLNKKAIS